MAAEHTTGVSRLAAADRGSLAIADVAGYTSYLLGTELEHAQDVLSGRHGRRRAAWREIEPHVLPGLDHAGAALVEQLERVARQGQAPVRS